MLGTVRAGHAARGPDANRSSAIEDSDWIEDRRQRLLFRIAREFERLGAADTALSLYLNCRHRGARTRAIRLKARAHDWKATRALCLRAQELPESEAELQYLRRALPWRTASWAFPMRAATRLP